MNANTSKHQMSFSNVFNSAIIVYIEKDELGKEIGGNDFITFLRSSQSLISGNTDYMTPQVLEYLVLCYLG